MSSLQVYFPNTDDIVINMCNKLCTQHDSNHFSVFVGFQS